eukprot:SM004973S17349  [mRNA]  locus=s4973:108:1070:- [translate_table: standard]
MNDTEQACGPACSTTGGTKTARHRSFAATGCCAGQERRLVFTGQTALAELHSCQSGITHEEEARTLFRRDQHLTDARLINQALFDGESRLELGVHYNIPYPRLHNLPTGSKVKTKVSTPVMGPVDDDDVMDDVLQARARHGGKS